MAIKDEYRKIRNKVLRYEREIIKQGFQLPHIPKIPKKITQASIRRLQKITKQSLEKKKYIVDPETGEILKGKRAEKFKEEYVIEKTTQYENEINGFLETIERTFPKSGLTDKIKNWIMGIVDRTSLEQVAQMLQDASSVGVFIDHTVMYSELHLQARLSEFLNWLPAPEGIKEELYEYLDNNDSGDDYGY